MHPIRPFSAVSAKPRGRFSWLVILTLCGIQLLVPAASAMAQSSPSPALFKFLPEAETRAVTGYVRRRQAVSIQHELLADAAPGSGMRFNLFQDVAFEADVEQVYTTERGEQVVAGRLKGQPESRFLLLTCGEEAIADFIASPLERYQLCRRENGGPLEVHRMDLTMGTPECGGSEAMPAVRRSPARARSAGTETGPVASVNPPDNPKRFDVLIAYTPAARDRAGGTASIQARASYAIEQANQSYNNSKITTQARLVQTMEVNYSEIGRDLRIDLQRLSDPGDGFMDEVHEARDLCYADLVCLFVVGPPETTVGSFIVGRATFAVETGEDGQLRGVPEAGFSVVAPFYDVGTTFPHEIGHNFGCQHDRENVIFNGVNYGPGIFPYSYGWRFTDNTGFSGPYRDIMSYAPGLVIPYFSNPQVKYFGAATGVADYADNARTINETAPFITNFRRLPLVSITASVSQAFENPLTPGRFTVSRTGPTDRSLTVNYRPVPYGGPVAPGVAFQPLPAVIVIPAGQSQVDLDVVPIDNATNQAPRLVTMRLLDGMGYRINGDDDADQASVRIEDTAETVSITVPQPTARRSPLQPAHFALTRTGPPVQPLTVALTLTERSLDENFQSRRNFQFDPPLSRLDPPSTPDAAVRNYAAVIPAGATTLDLAFFPDPTPITGLQVVDLALQSRDLYKPAIAAASVVVTNGDEAPVPPSEIAIVASGPTASATTGTGGQFLVSRSGRLDSQSVEILLTGTADPTTDYLVSSANNPISQGFSDRYTLPLAPGQASALININPRLNPTAATQTVIATLSFPFYSAFAFAPDRRSAVVTLLGNTALVGVTASGPEARVDSENGAIKGEFTFSREGDLSSDCVVRYLVGGSATGGVQYKALKGSVVIPAGSASATVKVKPLPGAVGKSTVKVTLQVGESYTLGPTTKAKVKVIGVTP